MKKEIIKFINYSTDIKFRDAIKNAINTSTFLYLITIIFIIYRVISFQSIVTYKEFWSLSAPFAVLFILPYCCYLVLCYVIKGKSSTCHLTFLAVMILMWLIMPRLLFPLTDLNTNNDVIFNVLTNCGAVWIICRLFVILMQFVNTATNYILKGDNQCQRK